jgi:DNA polymerase III delta subunit
MNVPELRNNINKGKIENIYLFSGPEIGEKNEIIRLLESKIFPDSKPVKYTFFCANEFEPAEFLDTLNSGLLFAENKIVILKNIEQANKSVIELIESLLIPRRLKKDDFEKRILSKISSDDKKNTVKTFFTKDQAETYVLKDKLKDSDVKKLITLLEPTNYKSYDKGTFLVMINETSDKIPAGIVNLLTQNQQVVFWEMFENQKPQWIRQEFKKYNLFIDDDGARFMLDTVENNKMQLEIEIQRISISFDMLKKNDKNVVTREIIEEFLYHSKEETAFTLYSAMLEKNLEKSMDILIKIFSADPESILPGLVWAHRRFLKALDLYENHSFSHEEIFSQLAINMKKLREEFVFGFKNFSFSEAVIMFHYLSELDYYLKILPEELKLVKLQEFIVNFIYGDIKKSFLRGKIITGHFDNINI